MIVLDANVLIGFLDANDVHHEACLQILGGHAVERFAAGVLTVSEALVHPTRLDRQDAALAALRRIGLNILSVGPGDAAPRARVRSQHGVRMPDAGALCAALSSVSLLATFDDALIVASERAGVPVVN
ncbi:PIN domain-containing protein [Salinibacterium sp.]|uniref:type II toxin-antitoxin system VapC family toxin n=1 Tax=Salinibacterium sp. TaxID=1915057 RepID=UPI00286AA816|nr:PIN domain-containing protein [Salinibacterium sp.]